MLKCRAKIKDLEDIKADDREFIRWAEAEGVIKDGYASGYYVDGYIVGELIDGVHECVASFEYYVAVDPKTVEVLDDGR